MRVSLFHSSAPLALCAALAFTSSLFLSPRESAVAGAPARATEIDDELPRYDWDLYVPKFGVVEALESSDFEFVDPLEHADWYAEMASVLAERGDLVRESRDDELRVQLLERPAEFGAVAAWKCQPFFTFTLVGGCAPALVSYGITPGKSRAQFCAPGCPPPCACTFAAGFQVRFGFQAGAGGAVVFTRTPVLPAAITQTCNPPLPPAIVNAPCPGGGQVRVRLFCGCFNLNTP